MIDSKKLPKEFIYMDDFSGEYSLATTRLTGEYIPADQNHPAYSAPIPDYAYLYDSVTSFVRELFNYIYYYSCQNYVLLASDIRGLKDPWSEDEIFFPAILDLFEEGKGWVVAPDTRILRLHVLEGRPRITCDLIFTPRQKCIEKIPERCIPSLNLIREVCFVTDQYTAR